MSCADAHVVIAVLTYLRPEGLQALLPLLIQQAAGAPLATKVLVVDNDPKASARSVVDSFGSDVLVYVNEPRPGIAAGRSRALLEARGARVLAFIDDDELPSAGWLRSLLDTYHRTEAAAVVGPVVSEFAVKPEDWISSGGFFQRRRLPTGTEVTVAHTGNLLLDLEQISRLGLDFDSRFGLTGGEDTLFTRQIIQRGGKIVWCDEALVADIVPEDRSTRKWVLQRAFSSGNTWSQVSLELAGGGSGGRYGRLGDHCRLVGAGCVRSLGGALRFVYGVATHSVADNAKGLRTCARGAGMLVGALGYSYQEYRRG
ncbi:glycosyltransferase family 2 protein [Pseudarthrobacter sp. O4]|uniref:glycosyltransferase family 2 protein n=1 Tax=Pseudarthrobacter sp. O4 TaxID=3418417 RepID=UPI003CF44D4A